MHYLWLALAGLFAIGEIKLPFFGLIFASIGSLVAMLVALTGFSWEYQLVSFSLATVVGVWLLRPSIIKKLQSPNGVPTRTEPLIGRKAVVCEEIDPATGKGRISIDGTDWAAKSSQPLALNTSVIIESADGIVLRVRKE